MRLYHELAKKPSAVVFKTENTRSSLQRSASGIAIPNYEQGNNVATNGLGRKSSQSNLYSYLQKGSPSNYSKPFGDGLQSSSSSSFKASNDYIPRKVRAYLCSTCPKYSSRSNSFIFIAINKYVFFPRPNILLTLLCWMIKKRNFLPAAAAASIATFRTKRN